VLPGLMKTPVVEKTAGLTAEYGGGDIEQMWKVRDAQCPVGDMGDAWDVAYACLYLASDESKQVTSLELVVDGGILSNSVERLQLFFGALRRKFLAIVPDQYRRSAALRGPQSTTDPRFHLSSFPEWWTKLWADLGESLPTQASATKTCPV
jgi:Enoyl-(Acyl carrier protein) reductase